MSNPPSVISISRRDRILGGLWGALVGDALGVPVEFKNRAAVQSDPVRGMRGHGTHNQPAGTWSDDSSLLLCTADSLLHHQFDTDDMERRFVAWYQEKIWTPWGKVFDIGIATSQALSRIARGMRAEVAGGDGESSNGNGSLMRLLPISIRFAGHPTKVLLDRVHRGSAITHRHPRSQMACGLYSLVVRNLLTGATPPEAFHAALASFREFYAPDSSWAVELDPFEPLLRGDLAICSEREIDSSGYVLHTLIASLWCLLTTGSYQECVLQSVNLGGDTDTTGCVAGGLAGIAYGAGSVPAEWIQQLARHQELAELFNEFTALCEHDA
jgi:ADP-ribosylglycohydrolase